MDRPCAQTLDRAAASCIVRSGVWCPMEISSTLTYNVHLLGLSAIGWSAVGWSFDLLGLSAMCCTYTPHRCILKQTKNTWCVSTLAQTCVRDPNVARKVSCVTHRRHDLRKTQPVLSLVTQQNVSKKAATKKHVDGKMYKIWRARHP